MITLLANSLGSGGQDCPRSCRPRTRLTLGGILTFLLLLSSQAQTLNVVTTNSAGELVFTNQFGDLNDDGTVDVLDVVCLTHHLNGTRLHGSNLLVRADLNQDGLVNATDRSILADMIARRNVKADDDFDNDELSNADEIRFGTNPFDPDTDHDGGLDGWEVIDGTNPLDPQSRMNIMVVARPPVTVIHPLLQNEDTNTCGTVHSQPPVLVISPLLQNTDTNTYGTILAQPPVLVVSPMLSEDTNTYGVVSAQPPVLVISPQLQNADTNAYGTILSRPPVLVISPLLQNTETNAYGVILAQPPVQVIYPLIQNIDTDAPGPVVANPPVRVINP